LPEFALAVIEKAGTAPSARTLVHDRSVAMLTEWCTFFSHGKLADVMRKAGLLVSAIGLLISMIGTAVLYQHTTNKYHSAIADIGSIAVAYLGLILLGISVSVTGIALILSTNPDNSRRQAD